MPFEHAAEAQRLTEHYAKMYDGELLNLAAESAGLTDIARSVLENELHKRGLDRESESRAQCPASNDPSRPRNLPEEDEGDLDREEDAAPDDRDRPVEFTWKTELCSCSDWEKGQLLRHTLYRAGIESWTEPPHARNYGMDFRILVPADQLEQALEIAQAPIPQDVMDDLKTETPAFEMPTCPHCGATDPVLEAAEGGNSWACEACGSRWTDSVEDSDQPSAK